MSSGMGKWILLISLITPGAWAESAMDRYFRDVAENKVLALNLTAAAKHNAPLIRVNERVNCGIVLASSEKIKSVIMTMKDGSQQKYILHGIRGPLDFDRRFEVATVENGVIKSATHHIVWGYRYGGWRFEVDPAKAKSCPNCERFKDVSTWTVEDVELSSLAGCKRPQDGPVISALPPTALSSDADEVAAGR